MRNRRILAAALSAGMTLGMLSTAFAGTWKVNLNGWWYEEDNGNRPVSEWKWIDGDGDGYAECYYFDADGYMVHNREINGFLLNGNGQWMAGDHVQSEYIGGGSGAASGGTQTGEAAYADVYRKYEAQYGKTAVHSEVPEYSEEPEKTLTGINFLGLYDMDGNGTEEFLIGYTTPNPEENSFCNYIFSLDVYTQEGGEAVLCGKIDEAEMWTGGESDCGIRLMSKGGKIYVVSGSQGTGAGSVYHFYGIGSGNRLEELQSYDIFEEIRINGQRTNQSYETLWDGWTRLGHYDVHGIEAAWAEDFHINDSVDHINAVKAKLGV